MKAALLGAALLFCAGCGSATTVTTTRTVTAPTAAAGEPRACVDLGGNSTYGYEICDFQTIKFGGKPLNIPRPAGAGAAGHWSGGYVSRDGRTLLLQWTAECETPYAYFAPAHGGTPRLVTGERSLADAPISIADGWMSDGRAIVELPEAGCGTGVKVPGVYLISPSGERTLIQRLPAQA